jgi:hypothetical protein
MSDVSNTQRGLWTFLVTALVTPFLTALLVMALSIGAGALGRGPDSLRSLDSAGQLAWAANKAVATFAWCVIPAVIAAGLAAVLVAARGRLGWVEAAVIGALVAGAGALWTGGLVGQHLAPILAIGALVGFAVWSILSGAGIAGARMRNARDR